ncbi:MAG: hypothetical protein RLZZ200_1655 [Pseudomonadota bacterium]|jgi:hypothetical protein
MTSATMDCQHRWKVGTPVDGVSHGECQFCGEERDFTDGNDASSATWNDRVKKRAPNCAECGGEFSSYDRLADHQEAAHRRCVLCSLDFDRYGQYLAHRMTRLHRARTVEAAREIASADIPENMPAAAAVNVCPDCPRTFVSALAVSIHRSKLHNVLSPRKQKRPQPTAVTGDVSAVGLQERVVVAEYGFTERPDPLASQKIAPEPQRCAICENAEATVGELCAVCDALPAPAARHAGLDPDGLTPRQGRYVDTLLSWLEGAGPQMSSPSDAIEVMDRIERLLWSR